MARPKGILNALAEFAVGVLLKVELRLHGGIDPLPVQDGAPIGSHNCE